MEDFSTYLFLFIDTSEEDDLFMECEKILNEWLWFFIIFFLYINVYIYIYIGYLNNILIYCNVVTLEIPMWKTQW